LSKHLSNSALKALTRMGDIMIPRNGEFPSFSETGCLEHVDDIVAYAPEDDISDLNTLLTVLSFMPTFVLKWLVNKVTNSYEATGALSALFRQVDFGLRGIIFTSYYSGKVGANYTGPSPLDILGYEVNRIYD